MATNKSGDWGWWLVGALAVGGLAVAATRKADRRGRARKIRQDADAELLTRLEDLAEDPGVVPWRRRLAAKGATQFRALWIGGGHSGRAIPAGYRKKFYGNWCGPGHGGGPCIDEIDCLCRDHDMKYALAERVEAGHA